MTQEEKFNYVEIGLKILNIQIHPEILKNVILVVDVVNKKKGKTDIKDILDIKKL